MNPRRNIVPGIMLATVVFFLVPTTEARSSGALASADRKNFLEFLSWPLSVVVRAYRSFLGRGIRSTCPMHPSCSAYSLEAMESRGPLAGALMTADRLNRCGHDLSIYRIQEETGVFKRLDVVEK